jgi:hypothetical protein
MRSLKEQIAAMPPERDKLSVSVALSKEAILAALEAAKREERTFSSMVNLILIKYLKKEN